MASLLTCRSVGPVRPSVRVSIHGSFIAHPAIHLRPSIRLSLSILLDDSCGRNTTAGYAPGVAPTLLILIACFIYFPLELQLIVVVSSNLASRHFTRQFFLGSRQNDNVRDIRTRAPGAFSQRVRAHAQWRGASFLIRQACRPLCRLLQALESQMLETSFRSLMSFAYSVSVVLLHLAALYLVFL